MVRPPQDRHPCIPELRQIGNHRVHFPFPGAVKRSARRAKGVPFPGRRPLVHGPHLVPVAVVAICVTGVAAVPHERDDASFLPFPDGRVHNVLAGIGHCFSSLDARALKGNAHVQGTGVLVSLKTLPDVIETEV